MQDVVQQAEKLQVEQKDNHGYQNRPKKTHTRNRTQVRRYMNVVKLSAQAKGWTPRRNAGYIIYMKNYVGQKQNYRTSNHRCVPTRLAMEKGKDMT